MKQKTINLSQPLSIYIVDQRPMVFIFPTRECAAAHNVLAYDLHKTECKQITIKIFPKMTNNTIFTLHTHTHKSDGGHHIGQRKAHTVVTQRNEAVQRRPRTIVLLNAS